MSLLKKIDEDLKDALKGGDKFKLTVLRGLKSDLKYKQIEKGDDLTEEDINVVIDEQNVDILEINRVREAAGENQYMFGCLIQVKLPERKSDKPYSVITITLTDPSTGDKGEGCLFLFPPEYVD